MSVGLRQTQLASDESNAKVVEGSTLRDRTARSFSEVASRLYGVGALGVRLAKWKAVREIAIYRPERIGRFYGNWLRFGLTMASRAQHLTEGAGERVREVNLLSLARARAADLSCLSLSGVDGDEVLSNLAAFDVLANIAAVSDIGEFTDRGFYPSWSRLRPSRVKPTLERFVSDGPMRAIVTGSEQDESAIRALCAVGQLAARVGISYDGFDGWEDDIPAVQRFISEADGT